MSDSTFKDRQFPLTRTTLMPINFSGARDLMMALGCPESVPMDMLSRHLKQVYNNHRQGLDLMASQGGLCVSEICSIMEDRAWQPQTHQEGVTALVNHLYRYSIERMSECQEEIAKAEERLEDLRSEIALLDLYLVKPSPATSPQTFEPPFPTTTARISTRNIKFEFTIFLLEDGEPPDPFGSEFLPVTPKVGETITLHYLDGRVACQAIVHEVQGTTLFVKDLTHSAPAARVVKPIILKCD
jgi:hypothetical protein